MPMISEWACWAIWRISVFRYASGIQSRGSIRWSAAIVASKGAASAVSSMSRLCTECSFGSWWRTDAGRARRAPSAPEPDHPCVGTGEAAAVEVEGGVLGHEVDVQPLAPGIGGEPGRLGDEGRPHAVALPPGLDDHVQQEGVHPAVPRDVREADHPAVVVGADPGEAVTAQ